MQCGKFLANHPDLKAVEAEDTAGSAAYIAQHKVRDGQPSALLTLPMYGMKVLQEDIHDNPHNFPIPRGLQSAEGSPAPSHRKGQQGEHRLQSGSR